MYRIPLMNRSTMKSVDLIEGEPIEHKIQRVLKQKEPIKDGAPIIWTEKKQGVISAYNIRTDRWEIACDAMDTVYKARMSQREGKPEMMVNKDGDQENDGKTETKGDGGAESSQGTATANE